MGTTFKPRTFAVTIFQGDDEARLLDLARRIDAARAAESKGVRSLGDVLESETLVVEYNEAVAKAEKRAAVVTLQALPRPRWRALVAEHPARDDNDEDHAVGVNEDTFAEALVPASIVSIKPSQGDQGDFLGALSDAQYGELYNAAFYLNRAVGPAPKALSTPSPSSDATSR